MLPKLIFIKCMARPSTVSWGGAPFMKKSVMIYIRRRVDKLLRQLDVWTYWLMVFDLFPLLHILLQEWNDDFQCALLPSEYGRHNEINESGGLDVKVQSQGLSLNTYLREIKGLHVTKVAISGVVSENRTTEWMKSFLRQSSVPNITRLFIRATRSVMVSNSGIETEPKAVIDNKTRGRWEVGIPSELANFKASLIVNLDSSTISGMNDGRARLTVVVIKAT
jgi:hypothetical protein